MEIKVLGTGCARCNKLKDITLKAVEKTGLDIIVTKEEDIVNIMNYGVSRTPALVINEKVVLTGKIPTEDELIQIINDNIK